MRGLLETLKRAGLRQAVAMSTCDRTELQIAADDPDAARDAVLAALAPRSGLSADELRESFYVASGDDAFDERDATERAMVGWALARGVPVLGVCRGMQFLQAYLGGRLPTRRSCFA